MKKLFIYALTFVTLLAPALTFARTVTPKGQVVEADVVLIKQFAYDADGNVEYVGRADAGSETDQPVWFIQKLEYDDGNITGMLNANGQPDFDKVWDNRESYTYK